MALYQLDPQHIYFPPAQLALESPNGLLAIGGELKPAWLLKAYKNGIFPWFNPGEPILWWSPDPRGVIRPNQIHANKSLRKYLKKSGFSYSVNRAFSQVIQNCATLRQKTDGTWITNEMIQAYIELHQQGHAHSIEVWQNQQLVGGLYGINIGGLFCGESMFHLVSNASKAAFNCLGQVCQQLNIQLIDCQMVNPHLETLGVYEMSRDEFLTELSNLAQRTISADAWIARELIYEP
ncbi:leucyl/phenylalanyl-tRNA--protein transferase [Catenovulum agarivorans]|uniref:leucyl/phenylalanyl-tRNA--protein transferase n=1 Tax=Catenovulum agarivorans TaxID=1172192 RepID=UPI00058CAA0B